MTADTAPILNRDLLPHNTCFGCGLENPAGLRIEVRRDPADPGALRARFTPTAAMVGFPGIIHGGAVYTAMDCLSTWVATLLGPNRGAGWLLRSARTTYHNPAFAGEPLDLHGRIARQGDAWEPALVRIEARRADGTLCVEAEFKVVPIAPDRLVSLAGLGEIPANWQVFLSGGAGA